MTLPFSVSRRIVRPKGAVTLPLSTRKDLTSPDSEGYDHVSAGSETTHGVRENQPGDT
jgi:hypothetical protein